MEINVDGRDPRSSDRAGRRRTVDGSTRPDSELLDWVREEDSERREAAVAGMLPNLIMRLARSARKFTTTGRPYKYKLSNFKT